jgi:hypothetical protein
VVKLLFRTVLLLTNVSDFVIVVKMVEIKGTAKLLRQSVSGYAGGHSPARGLRREKHAVGNGMLKIFADRQTNFGVR